MYVNDYRFPQTYGEMSFNHYGNQGNHYDISDKHYGIQRNHYEISINHYDIKHMHYGISDNLYGLQLNLYEIFNILYEIQLNLYFFHYLEKSALASRRGTLLLIDWVVLLLFLLSGSKFDQLFWCVVAFFLVVVSLCVSVAKLCFTHALSLLLDGFKK
jgi:hypothetical protein